MPAHENQTVQKGENAKEEDALVSLKAARAFFAGANPAEATVRGWARLGVLNTKTKVRVLLGVTQVGGFVQTSRKMCRKFVRELNAKGPPTKKK
jgi:hypothetical protein